MECRRILIVPKITKVDWDLHRLGFTKEQLKEFYEEENLNCEKIFESHKNQKESLGRIKKLLGISSILNVNDLTKEAVKGYDLVIAFGGDNHFQFVSHFLDDIPILGMNSDPKRSDGALTTVDPLEFEKFFENNMFEDFKVDEWTRLQVEIDGKEIRELAISEVFIGEEKRFNMSRHLIRKENSYEEQKGSGLIVATGAGSTGWYNSSSRYLFPQGNVFPKNSMEAEFILSEPHKGKLSTYELKSGKINNGEFIELISLSDSSPHISIDALKLIKLREGSKVKVGIGKSLRVLVLK